MKKGDTFQHSFKVTEDIYKGFIDIFRDRNPLHTNAAFAQQKGFSGQVMFGNILNGFISYFVGECLPIKDVMIVSQEIKYSNPVYLNDNLDFYARVTDVFESVKLVEIKYYFEKSPKVKVAQGKIQVGII
jgi:3-hydroxybutyryl-CoA dehydratase